MLVTDDRQVSYQEYGSGPVALLIHGSPGDAKAWARVAERLADRYRVIAPDLPGHGGTPSPPADRESDIGYASESIEAVVRHVGAPAVVAGHSYGGVVALAVALRGEVPVGALALFEPVALEALRMAGDLGAYTWAKDVFEDYIARVEGGDDGAVRRMIDFWFGDGTFGRMPQALTAYFRKEARSNSNDVRATFRVSYSPDAFRRLEVPTAVIVGDRSPDITHRIARAIVAHVRSGSLTTLDNADHALTATHVEAVAQAIAAIARPPER